MGGRNIRTGEGIPFFGYFLLMLDDRVYGVHRGVTEGKRFLPSSWFVVGPK